VSFWRRISAPEFAISELCQNDVFILSIVIKLEENGFHGRAESGRLMKSEINSIFVNKGSLPGRCMDGRQRCDVDVPLPESGREQATLPHPPGLATLPRERIPAGTHPDGHRSQTGRSLG
jgi:hypothetical protein